MIRLLWRGLLFLALALASGFLLVVAAYWAGTRFIGPFAGARGLATFLGNIYADAGQGSPLALTLLAGPLAIGLAWKLRGWSLRRRRMPPATGDGETP
ncbi:MAG: hypothetical protein H3C57_06770 [Gammaproteobacteria bacterium]|nr:hypothetical protein [Gammaproteobacteria bacterium]